MKKTLLLALCSLQMVAGCVSQAEKDAYSKAYEAAITVPLKDQPMGLEFKPDMNRPQAETHLEELRKANKLSLSMPLFGEHDIEDVKLGYLRDTLTEVIFKVDESEVYFDDVKDMLTERYPSKPYHHISDDGKAISWFNGPIQIQVEYRKEHGTELSYRDMRKYSWYLHAQSQELLNKLDAEEAKQKEELKRL